MNVFEYNSMNSFFKDYFNFQKRKNPKFSIRTFSKELEITSPGALNQMLNGKRNIPAKHFQKFLEHLNFSIEEEFYLKELYIQSLANVKISFLNKINPLRWKKMKVASNEDTFKYPVLFAIRDILKREDMMFADVKKLEKELCLEIKSKDIESAYKFYCFNEKKYPKNARLVNQFDKKNTDVQDIHCYFLELAKKRIRNTDVSQREYNNFSVNIKKSDIPLIKSKIRFAIDSILEEFSDNEEGDATYQITNAFYPLSKTEKICD